MSQPSAPLRLGTPAARGTLLAAILGSGMVFLDSTVVNVALPHIGAELKATTADLQWTLNGYLLTLAAFVLLGGALGDRFGRRRVFLIGVLWFTVASLLCGVAQNIEWLIGARFLQGLGGALLTPGSLSLIQSSFHRDDRGKAIGTWSGLAGVSTALGPFLGGYLIDSLSWRWIFLLNLPLAVLVALAALRWAPESRAARGPEPAPAGRPEPAPAGRPEPAPASADRPGPASADRPEPAAGGRSGGAPAPGPVRRLSRHPQFDLAGALLGALALAGITFALIEARQLGGTSWPVAAAIVIAILAAVAFVTVERHRGEAAMLPPTLFSNRLFSVLNIYTVAVYAALGGLTFFLAVHLQVVAGYSALETGVATLPLTILLLIGSPRSGALASRIGPRLQLSIGPLFSAAGFLLLRRIGPHASYWTDVLPGVALFGIGMMLVVAPLTASVLAAVADRYAGVASGVNNAASRAGGLLAVAALPLIVGLSESGYGVAAQFAPAFRTAMFYCAGLMVAGAVLAAVLVHRPHREPPPSRPCPSLPPPVYPHEPQRQSAPTA